MARMPKRRRPHISVTPSQETLDLFLQIGQERGLDARGVIMDFIVHDYVRLRSIKTALQSWSVERTPMSCLLEGAINVSILQCRKCGTIDPGTHVRVHELKVCPDDPPKRVIGWWCLECAHENEIIVSPGDPLYDIPDEAEATP